MLDPVILIFILIVSFIFIAITVYYMYKAWYVLVYLPMLDMEANRVAYTAKIEHAKIAFLSKKYDVALGFYKEALELKPDDSYVVQKITMIEAKMQDDSDRS